jgi:hypothetical protein
MPRLIWLGAGGAKQMATLELVESPADIQKNIWTLEGYGTGSTEEQEFHKNSITHGHNFVTLKNTDGSYLFAPSRFVGYKNNDVNHTDRAKNHSPDGPDGGSTDSRITKILGQRPTKGDQNNMDDHFKKYCSKFNYTLKKERPKRPRKYWVPIGGGGMLTDDDVQEGYLQDQKKQFRARNGKIIVDRKKHDDYTCQSCNFRLKVRGVYIIDCHHRYPLSAGARVTILDDLVCLCPACHRIAHSTKFPLSVNEIQAVRQAAGLPVFQ